MSKTESKADFTEILTQAEINTLVWSNSDGKRYPDYSVDYDLHCTRRFTVLTTYDMSVMNEPITYVQLKDGTYAKLFGNPATVQVEVSEDEYQKVLKQSGVQEEIKPLNTSAEVIALRNEAAIDFMIRNYPTAENIHKLFNIISDWTPRMAYATKKVRRVMTSSTVNETSVLSIGQSKLDELSAINLENLSTDNRATVEAFISAIWTYIEAGNPYKQQ